MQALIVVLGIDNLCVHLQRLGSGSIPNAILQLDLL